MKIIKSDARNASLFEFMTPLLGLTPDELRAVATRHGLPAFTAGQMADWLYKKHVATLDEMTNLSQKARKALTEEYEVGIAAPAERLISRDGTEKYLFPTRSGHCVETVYIPDGERATVCVSSQVGCKMQCAFCMTGRQGFAAQLTVSDILSQIFGLPYADRLTNIVFMGQGEPLDNLDAVLRAIEVLTAPWGWGWSPRRITVSTVGLKKGLTRFLEESKCHLAVSLHHPLPADRAALMPAERAWSMEEVVATLKNYFPAKGRAALNDALWEDSALEENGDQNKTLSEGRRLTFEYIVFHGLNDTRRHADALLRLLAPLRCRVNLIPFHDIPNTPLRGASREEMVGFRNYLTDHGLFTTLRASRGQDIFAACGLLNTKHSTLHTQH